MKFKVKILNYITEGPLVAVLNRKEIALLNLKAADRIRVKKGNRSEIAVVDISFGRNGLKDGEVGLFSEAAQLLNVKTNDEIEILLEPNPTSLELIKKKMNKHELNKEEINLIIKDIVEDKLTDVEATYFVAACYINKMTLEESAFLAEAIVSNGSKLVFDKKIVVDKHCIGGIAANRTTPVVVPIVAAAGLTIPKTSTRSITSPAGTADTVEVLCPVTHSKEKIQQIVKKTNGCMVWGGTLDLASADDKLIKLEKQLNLDPEGFLLASILAKKAAVSSTHVLIDIPIGKEAKLKTKKEAKQLGKKFIKIGKKLHMKVKIIITDGSEPIGNGVGPALEAVDVLKVLQNDGPKDLREKSLTMAALIMKMAGISFAKQKARKILESGQAYKKLQEIIKEQGGNPNIQPKNIKLGKYTFVVKAPNPGKIKEINNNLICRIAKSAGAPTDPGAGVYLHRKVNDKVNVAEPIFTIYAESKEKLEFAKKENIYKAYFIEGL